MKLREFVIGIGFELDDASMRSVEQRSKAFVDSLGDIGRKASMYLSAPIAAASVFALKAASDLEQMDVAFEVFLQDADLAKKVVADLMEFTARTPFRLRGVQQASQMLLAMGVRGENLIETLRILGDVSRGNQELLQRVSLAYGQVLTARKLRGQELRQFTEAGVGLVEELSKLTGISESELASSVGEYSISSDLVMQALRNMTAEGGRFHQLLARQAKTLGGLMTTLADSFYFFAGAIGKEIVELFSLNKVLERLIEIMNKGLKVFDEFSESQKRLIIFIGILLFAIGPLLLAFWGLLKAGWAIVGLLKAIAGAFTLASGGAALLNGAVALIPILVLAVVAALYLLIDELIVWSKGGDSLVGRWLGSFDKIKPKLMAVWNGVKEVFSIFWNWAKDYVIGEWKILTGFLTGDSDRVIEGLKQAFMSYVNLFSDVFGLIRKYGPTVLEVLDEVLMNIWVAFRDTVNTLVINFFKVLGELVGKLGTLLFEQIVNLKDELVSLPGVRHLIDIFKKEDPSAGQLPPGSYKHTFTPNFGKKNGSSNTLNMNNNIRVELPAGTPEVQAAHIKASMEKVASEVLGKEARHIMNNNAGGE